DSTSIRRTKGANSTAGPGGGAVRGAKSTAGPQRRGRRTRRRHGETGRGDGERPLASASMDEVRVDSPGEAAGRSEGQAWLAGHWDPATAPRRWLEQLVDSGWAAPTWPRGWYGRGLPSSLAGVVEDEVAGRRSPSGSPVHLNLAANLWANTVLAHGTDELK